MNVTDKKILVFENGLDIRHLGSNLTGYNIESSFTRKIEEFEENLISEKFDLIIISLVDHVWNDTSIVQLVSGTPNSSSPILIIFDTHNIPDTVELLHYGFDILTFPFPPAEFVFRIQQILKSAATGGAIENNLKGYKDLIDSAPVGIVQTDTHGSFISANARFLTIIEMDESALMSENFFQLCHPDDYFLERKQLDRLLKKEIDRIEYERRLINNEGNTVVCGVTATVAWHDDGHFNSFTFAVERIP